MMVPLNRRVHSALPESPPMSLHFATQLFAYQPLSERKSALLQDEVSHLFISLPLFCLVEFDHL